MLVNTTTQGQIEALTVKELYDWACANGCGDAVIRYYDGGMFTVATEIEDVVYPAYMDSPAVSILGQRM